MEKKFLFSIFLAILCAISALGATTKSYMLIACNSSNGPRPVTGTICSCVEFYDGYLLWNGSHKYVYRATNYDGSMQYYPTFQENGMSRTIGLVVAPDKSAIRMCTESSIGGIRFWMNYEYNYIGEGLGPAANMMNGSFGDVYNGESGSNSFEWTNCSTCTGSGRCKWCGGSGRDSYTPDGRCHVCRGTGRCAACRGEGGYR